MEQVGILVHRFACETLSVLGCTLGYPRRPCSRSHGAGMLSWQPSVHEKGAQAAASHASIYKEDPPARSLDPLLQRIGLIPRKAPSKETAEPLKHEPIKGAEAMNAYIQHRKQQQERHLATHPSAPDPSTPSSRTVAQQWLASQQAEAEATSGQAPRRQQAMPRPPAMPRPADAIDIFTSSGHPQPPLCAAATGTIAFPSFPMPTAVSLILQAPFSARGAI